MPCWQFRINAGGLADVITPSFCWQYRQGLRLSEMTGLKRQHIILGAGAHVRLIGGSKKKPMKTSAVFCMIPPRITLFLGELFTRFGSVNSRHAGAFGAGIVTPLSQWVFGRFTALKGLP
jgi:hypothetical protein